MPLHPVRSRAAALLIGLVLALAVAACGGAGPSGSPPGGAGTTLAGTSWIVLSVAGRSPIAGAVPTISFTADTVGGSGGCNHIGGKYLYDAATGQLAVRDLGSTAMGCLQAGVVDFESAFLQALGSATQARLDANGQLILDGPAGRVVLVTLEHP